MIRPSNWTSRWLSSLLIVDMGTVKVAAAAVVAVMVRWPVTDEVRPTAVWLCPASTSFTRYPTTEPLATVQVPAAGPDETVWPPAEADALAVALRLSGAGALPSMKWMKMKGPPTPTTMTAATPAITHLSQCRDPWADIR